MARLHSGGGPQEARGGARGNALAGQAARSGGAGVGGVRCGQRRAHAGHRGGAGALAGAGHGAGVRRVGRRGQVLPHQEVNRPSILPEHLNT